MKKRSDMHLPRGKRSSFVQFTPKHQADLSSVQTGFSYLPFDLSRQLFSQAGEVSSDEFFSRRLLSIDGSMLGDTLSYKIASVLISHVSKSSSVCDEDNRCSDSFYSACVSSFLSSHRDVEDRDLLVIFFKQMMMILKHCGVVKACNGSVSVVRGELSTEALYLEIFNAFWDGVLWDHLFPSMPRLASMLQRDRYVLIELLSSRAGVFTVEEIASDYCDIMGIPCDDMLLYVSFFDFSFFTWMSNFGIISYRHDDVKVQAVTTDWGRSFFSAIE